MGFAVTVVSRRAGALRDPASGLSFAETTPKAFLAGAPTVVVIASETARHSADLAELASLSYSGVVLAEKPLFATPEAVKADRWPNLRVAYQLRFHPVVRRIRSLIADDRPLCASLTVGQHLDQWRPERPGHATYSGNKAAGGGVLRDLSHELDLADHLFGPCRSIAALGGRLGSVTVDSDDCWSMAAVHEHCPQVSLQMDYLDRIGRRAIRVITERQSIHADLVSGSLNVNGLTERFAVERDAPIRAMYDDVLSGGGEACALPSALRTMNVIDAAERASAGRIWIDL
jgi:predicted dehydrogenase